MFSYSVVSNSVTPWTVARQDSLSFTISQSFLKLMSIESVMPPNHLVLCHPLLLLPSIFPSIRVFSKEKKLAPDFKELASAGTCTASTEVFDLWGPNRQT